MNIQLIYPEHLQDWVGDGTKRPEKSDEFNYIGISIEERRGIITMPKAFVFPSAHESKTLFAPTPSCITSQRH